MNNKHAIFRVATGPLPAGNRVDERAYNIGTGHASTVLDVARTLLAAAGTTVPIEFAPPRAGELLHSCLAVDKARELLGWSPRVSLAEGLANTYRWSADGAVARTKQPT